MPQPDHKAPVRWIVLGLLGALIAAIFLAAATNPANRRSLDVARPPVRQVSTSPAVTPPQAAQAALPSPQPTVPTTPIPTPPTPVPTITPLLPTPPPTTPVTAITIVQAAQVPTTTLSPVIAAYAPEPIQDLIWAPTGDKVLYVTRFGNLYWSNPDGSNATLLLANQLRWNLLADQQPMTNTLFLSGYILRFAKGQPPVVQPAPATPGVGQFHWWRPDRVSGIAGDMLVTFDANGALVDRRHVPYLWFGAVQPGGEWLAYATEQNGTTTPYYGSDEETAYLLNLRTGLRLRVTPPGSEAWYVENWSPDGQWFLMSAVVNAALNGVIVSASGQQWLVLNDFGGGASDGVWSPDSHKLAFTETRGGIDEPHLPPQPVTITLYLVDVRNATVSPVSVSGEKGQSVSQIRQPRWSPDGSRLAVLIGEQPSGCLPPCDSPLAAPATPSFYILPAP